jgi:hypothetical protein
MMLADGLQYFGIFQPLDGRVSFFEYFYECVGAFIRMLITVPVLNTTVLIVPWQLADIMGEATDDMVGNSRSVLKVITPVGCILRVDFDHVLCDRRNV